jgi:hypothetical protein
LSGNFFTTACPAFRLQMNGTASKYGKKCSRQPAMGSLPPCWLGWGRRTAHGAEPGCYETMLDKTHRLERTLEYAVMNTLLPQKAGNFLISCAATGFSRRILSMKLGRTTFILEEIWRPGVHTKCWSRRTRPCSARQPVYVPYTYTYFNTIILHS